MIFCCKTFAEKTIESKGRKYDQLKRKYDQLERKYDQLERSRSMNQSKDEPFGRQPKPVTVTITGDDPRDVEYWVSDLAHRAEFKGDQVQRIHPSSFIIHPRAMDPEPVMVLDRMDLRPGAVNLVRRM